MENEPKITHRQIVEYIQGTTDKETSEHILKSRKAVPVYMLLFDLIDKQKDKVTLGQEAIAATDIPSTFSALEEMLMRIFAGDTLQSDAEEFIHGLMLSPVFYQRLLSRLAAVKPEIAFDEIPEMAQIRVRSDEEILRQIMTQTKTGLSKSKTETAPQYLPELWSRLSQFLKGPIRLPHYAYAAALVLIVSLVGIYTYQEFVRSDPFALYVYDDKEPYVPRAWRSSTPPLEDDEDYNLLNYKLQTSLAPYVRHEYAGTIDSLNALVPLVNRLKQHAHNSKIGCLLRDYCFYLGVSYFALFRSQNAKTEEQTKALYLENAIQNLQRAAYYADATTCPNEDDKEVYFLGLAHGFAGDLVAAVSLLKRVDNESPFFKDSEKLITFWGIK